MTDDLFKVIPIEAAAWRARHPGSEHPGYQLTCLKCPKVIGEYATERQLSVEAAKHRRRFHP